MNTKTISALAAFTIASAVQAELFVQTLAATDITGDSALLNMTVSGTNPGTVFEAQIFDFGLTSGRLSQQTSGYDYALSFVYDPTVGERTLVETYNVRDLPAMFEVIDPATNYDHQLMSTVGASSPMTLNLWNLLPETTYYVKASAVDVNTGIVYFGQEISFSTLSYAEGGFGLEFASGGSVIPEPSSLGLWIGLGMIGFIARRRKSR